MGCAGIEPATSSMSTKRSPTELTAHNINNILHIFQAQLILYKNIGYKSIKRVKYLLHLSFVT